jgi:hypothetical protein
VTVRITSPQPAIPPGGPPPGFSVSTDREHFDVEVAADPALLDGALAARRTPRNFFALRGVAGRDEEVRVAVDAAAWSRLRTGRALYYRALAYDGNPTSPRGLETTVEDPSRAPAVEIAPSPTQPPPIRGPISSGLPWLRVEGNRIVDRSGRIVVLRGINRPGLEALRRGNLDPTGTPGRTSREAAGITRDEVREIVRGWNANVIRLPINQHWALTRPEYVADLDQIVAWAAAEGAYTILALARLDPAHAWGTDADGTPNLIAPFPDESSLRLWRMLGARYAREPAVLYDLYSVPHEPLATDEVYPFGRLETDEEWVAVWHTWARRIEAVVHRVNGRALLFVAGWDWGLNLRSFPVPQPGGRVLANAVYAAHLIPADTAALDEDFEYWFGFTRLREEHPVYVAAWGAGDDELAWAERLEAYLRDRARVASGSWQGLAGWCAWSWSEPPLLVERRTVQVAGKSWRTFERDPSGSWIPTAFGRLVKAALEQPVDVPAAEGAGARTPQPAPPRLVASTPAIAIGKGVGRGKPNEAADVGAVQDRLHALRYLADADYDRERPAQDTTAAVSDAALAATIAAIELLEGEVQGLKAPDGAVDETGKTLAALNRALPRPTEEERLAVRAARDSIVEDRIQGVPIGAAVGNVPAASPGPANEPDDVRAVQVRLVRLGFLRPDHAESPGEGASLTPAVLRATRDAIKRFQTREVSFWKKANAVTGTITSEVVAPDDATHALLGLISTYVERLPRGKTVEFRDYPATPFTVHPRGASYVGTESPWRLPLDEWTTLGLTEPEAKALRYLTSNEGNFDAINTFDIARISFGSIQFAGGRGLPRFMALFKASRADAFRRVFAAFGIEVEYDLEGDDVLNAVVTVVDPASARLLRGSEAETALQADPRMWAAFVAAGADRDVQLAQIDAATRDYVRPPLAAPVEYTAASGMPTSATLSALLDSEKGLAMLIDRAVQEGPDVAVKRLGAALRRVAVDQGLAAIGRVAPFEASVLRQVVFDLDADLDLWQRIASAVAGVAALKAAAAEQDAVVADVLAGPSAAAARTALDAAVAAANRKSLYVKDERLTYLVSRDWILTRIAPQRTALDFTPAPTTPVQVASAADAVQTGLTALLPFKTAADQDYLARLRAIRNRVAEIRDTADLAGPPER